MQVNVSFNCGFHYSSVTKLKQQEYSQFDHMQIKDTRCFHLSYPICLILEFVWPQFIKILQRTSTKCQIGELSLQQAKENHKKQKDYKEKHIVQMMEFKIFSC